MIINEPRNTALEKAQIRVCAVEQAGDRIRAQRAIRVFMMDLLSIVPYYTGHLCAALKQVDELRVDLGSITYYLDRELFVRRNLRTDPDLLDLASRVPTCPAALRRALKAVECLINMAALLLRFSFTKPDVIHVQFLPMAAVGLPFELWFLRIARRFGIKVVYTVHNLLPHDTEDRQRGRYRRIYEFMDRLICHDVSARGRLYREFGVPLERISVIPHGPLLERVSSRTPEQARKELGISGDQCLVLWQGILRPYKGVLFLLKAWRQVCSKGVRACLAVVGPGDEELTRAVAEEVSALAISSSVRLEPRFVSIEERDNFYLAADIVVYPYSAVTTSGALMTGIGYGKAIVASRLAAFDQILRDGENALLVEYGDVDKLADALFELIREPGLRRRLGENARNSHANGPRWPEIARQTLTCYESALLAGCPIEPFRGRIVTVIRKKFETFNRILRDEGPRSVVASSWQVFEKWWRQGELWELRKSGYVRLGGCRIGLDDPIAQSFHNLLTTGVFERPERIAIKKFLNTSLPVVELGGCIGVVACTTNRRLRNPAFHVVVEANPELTPLLEANRDRNRCKFFILQRAVGYDSPFVSLHINDGNLLESSARTRAGREIRVPVITLREIVNQFSFARCNLICDIEGTEVELVRHERDTLARHVDLLIVEVHRKLLGADPVSEMMNTLKEIGFETVYKVRDAYVLKNRRVH